MFSIAKKDENKAENVVEEAVEPPECEPTTGE
jgi:hypothetical protein